MLAWDSNFFGFKVAKISYKVFNIKELNQILELLRKEGFMLVYYSSLNVLSDDKLLLKYNGQLVDEKVTFFKQVNVSLSDDRAISNFELNYPTPQMINLGIESGVYSRFKLDSRISNDKFEALYKLWVINSVNKSIANSVLVYEDSNQTLGLVTLAKKKDVANIGIIAVDSNLRGKGIGRKLMIAAENWTYNNSCSKIKVVTQGFNKPANKLYNRCGYSIEKTEFFYHFWLNNENFNNPF